MLLQNEGLQSKQHAKLIIQQGTAQRDAGVLHEDIFIFFLNVAKCTTFWQMAPSFCSPCSQTHLGSAQGRTYCDTLGLQNPPLCWSHLCSPPHPNQSPTRPTLSSSIFTFQTLWVTNKQTRMSSQDPYSVYLEPVKVYQWHMHTALEEK